MSTVSSTIGTFLNGLNIASYTADRRTPEEFLTEFATMSAGVSALGGFAGENIARTVGELLDNAQTALDQLALYASEADAGARQGFAETAITEADTALNGLVNALLGAKSSLSTVSLAFGFGALHYGILVRQFVADMVQDGPMGAPGLTQQITTAAQLLYDGTDGTGLYTAFLSQIAEGIIVANVQGTDADPEVSFDIFSPIGEVGLSVTIRRASGETNEEFKTRIEALTAQQAEVVFLEEQEQIGAAAALAIGQAQNATLASNTAAVAGLHERIGTDEANVETGTELADYFSGLGGDDLLSGGIGPDALSGGEGNDILRGGADRDMLVGGAGNDVMFGAEARSDAAIAPDGDTARFFGLASEYTVLGGTDYAVVIGPDGRDKLFDVSFLRFDGGDVALQAGDALDTGDVPFETLNKTNFDTGERVVLLYEAALNRNGNIDLPGLNFYVDVTDRDNLSDEFLAQDLMTSPEFTDNFGDVNTLSNADFLTVVYTNVLERTPDSDGLQFYLNLLDSNEISRALALADIAVSPENTNGSSEILRSLYETTAPQIDTATNIALDWSFVA